MIIVRRKKGFEFSFAWLFAIIAGAAIIFLAVYFSGKMIRTESYKIDTITAKQLSIIFEPLEVGLASGKSNIASLKDESRIYNKCLSEGSFGRQKIYLASKVFGKWQEAGGGIEISNKYIFSSDIEEGKIIYFFSKQFKMPFKVSEVIFMTTKKYCFVDAPESIEDEVLGLGLGNVKIGNCSDEIKVCFGYGNCEIKVNGLCAGCEDEYDYGVIEKDKEKIYYSGFSDSSGNADRSMLYAGIFSGKEIYECNMRRLMKRLVQEALIYKDKSSFLADKCGYASSAELFKLVNIAVLSQKSLSMENMNLLKIAAEEADEKNEASECRLW